MTSAIQTVLGRWTTSDDLHTAGAWDGQHDGAVLLTDGTVLVAGGADASSAALARTARFNPAAGTDGEWAEDVAMHTARRLHSTTRLADGKVLVAGGTGVGNQFPAPGLPSAEIYDPVGKSWAPAGGLHVGRWGHSAVLLADGSVLVAGGTAVRSGQSVTALRSVERYVPKDDKWTEVAPMTDARTGHPAVVLSNGRVLVVGGSVPTGRDDEAALAYCEIYDPKEDTWTPTGNLLAPRTRHQAVAVSDTTVLVTGGSPPGPVGDGTFDPVSRATAELFTVSAGAWTAAKPMPAGRGHHRAVPLGSGKVLVVGGTDRVRDDVGFSSALVYDAGSGDWSVAAGLTVGRWAFAATALADHRVLVTGGVARTGLAAATGADELTVSTEIFTLAAGS
jgi:N-acetylneuraminic acid mutarotase